MLFSFSHRLPLYYEIKILFVLWLVLPITEVSHFFTCVLTRTTSQTEIDVSLNFALCLVQGSKNLCTDFRQCTSYWSLLVISGSVMFVGFLPYIHLLRELITGVHQYFVLIQLHVPRFVIIV